MLTTKYPVNPRSVAFLFLPPAAPQASPVSSCTVDTALTVVVRKVVHYEIEIIARGFLTSESP